MVCLSGIFIFSPGERCLSRRTYVENEALLSEKRKELES